MSLSFYALTEYKEAVSVVSTIGLMNRERLGKAVASLQVLSQNSTGET
jgi:hypothetical protein